MIDKSWRPLSLIGVETPTLLLPFLYRLADILVVADLDAFVFLQSNPTSSLVTTNNDIGLGLERYHDF